eukprot:TRINITY_DN7002_c0_g2_i2.p1 TRINITY_DN7002_c0_g2~~TRINITY_DN7002_c0_g2_i2.p1  ORF type:complete len:211 (+),score=51.45 TRINITY_DN7002_c0_g2_i2:231-863(+)
MKLKQLEAALGGLEQFQAPKVQLEQYPTGPHIAARILYTMESSFGDVEGRTVMDMGCGCGTLGIAASLLSAGHVIGVDCDADALAIAAGNCSEMEVEMDFLHADIRNVPLKGDSLCVDTVVMNPPFGTRRKGADMEFLWAACQIARVAVYSLHKSSTREHVKRTAMKLKTVKSAEVVYELRYDIPLLYSFHRRAEVDIAADLWRFQISQS